MSEPHMEILNAPRRPRGRPRVLEQRTSLSTWLPISDYDRLVALARTADKSLSALVRDALKNLKQG